MPNIAEEIIPRRSIYRLSTVTARTGFGRAWIYELMKRGEFPRCRKIGARAVGWDSHEVEAWIAERLDAGR